MAGEKQQRRKIPRRKSLCARVRHKAGQNHGVLCDGRQRGEDDGRHKGKRIYPSYAGRVRGTYSCSDFAFSFKNVRGTEITGTNSMIEKAFLESAEPGQIKEITFTQKMSLQGGEYLISMGVTGYNGDTFEVYHRLYDAMNITVVSDKDTVGYYDMDSAVTVTDAR